MEKLKVLSLFSGIGAFEKALERECIPHEVVAYCEIDKFASKSYSIIHNISETKNLGDISKVDTKTIPDCDLVTYGFPCQDISVAGLQKGIKEGETRSGLLFEALRIIETKKPKYAIAENVKNLVGKRFKDDFEKLLKLLDGMGYNSYWRVLNAKDYGIPQQRERVFVVSIRKDIDTKAFSFPKKQELTMCLRDMLEATVDDKYFLSDTLLSFFIRNAKKQKELGNNFRFKVTTGDGVAKAITTRAGSRMEDNFVKARRVGVIPKWHERGIVYSDKALAPTLCATDYKTPKLIEDSSEAVRKLTPKECWRLMGFDDIDVDKCKGGKLSDTQLYKQAGNSIVVNVLQAIFRSLF